MNRTTLHTLLIAGFAFTAAQCSQSSPNPGQTSAGGNVANDTGGSTSQPGTGGAVGIGGDVGIGGTPATLTGGSPGTNTGGAGATIGTGGVVGTGGKAGVTGGSVGVGGIVGNGGVINTGGKAGTMGGVVGITGGNASTAGGVVGITGGASATGGKAGTTGGVVGITGGASATGGKANATGGTASITGGAPPTGGAPGATGGAGSTTLDPNVIVPKLDGYLWTGTCSDGSLQGLDCPLNPIGTTTCPNPTAAFATQGLFRYEPTITVGGTPGTQYTINIEVRGVLGTKCYQGGTMQAPALSANPETTNNGWYVGGQPVVSKWNTYEVHVSPAVASAASAVNPLDTTEDVYFLNAFPYPPAIAYGTKDTYCEAHETFPMKYTASFPVMGGGTIKMLLHDSNCLGQMNCGGPDLQTTCANPRTIDLTGMSPLPANFTQPYKQSNGDYPQWALIDVKTITSP